MRSLTRWNLLATILVGVLTLVLHSETASAQAQALPYSATNIPISAGNPNFSVKVNLLTAPNRPQLRVIATPDAAHPNMRLEIHIDEGQQGTDEGCAEVFFGGDCIDFTNGSPLSWTSNSAPGAVEWVADIWKCVPDPDNQAVTGNPNPQCKVEVTASNFGSSATFNLQVIGETRPVTGTIETVVNPAGGSTSGSFTTERVPFMTDAGNFRWIYDEDQPEDNIVETFHPSSQAQLGECKAFPEQLPEDEPADIFSVPYIYTYLGDPSYVGFDCCTWQMDSDTGTTGSGQALWYVNLGLGSQPPDSDNDGFFDPCDNCVNVPNGPFLGTCVESDGTGSLTPCLSEQQCGPTEICSMAQEDNDFDPDDGALACPEPDATALLSAGILCLVALERRRRRSA